MRPTAASVIAPFAADYDGGDFESHAAEVSALLSDISNYKHRITTTESGGGKWSAATSISRHIHKSLLAAFTTLVKASLGRVGSDECVVIINHDEGDEIAASGEMSDYISTATNSYYSNRMPFLQIRRLPNKLYGLPIVCHDSIRLPPKSAVLAGNGRYSSFLRTISLSDDPPKWVIDGDRTMFISDQQTILDDLDCGFLITDII